MNEKNISAVKTEKKKSVKRIILMNPSNEEKTLRIHHGKVIV
jgi:hypothetical protein